MSGRGNVSLYFDDNGGFFGVGVRLGGSTAIILPDGTLLPTGTSVVGKAVLHLRGDQARSFLKHVVHMGRGLAGGFERCPEGMGVRMDVVLRFTAEPVVSSATSSKETEE
jgi:hypothetical protein